VPPVASKASVLHSQTHGLGQRSRAPEAKQPASPFSLLLDNAGEAPPRPAKDHCERAQASPPPRKSSNDASRSDQDAPETENPEPQQQGESVAPAKAQEESSKAAKSSEISVDVLTLVDLADETNPADDTEVAESELAAALLGEPSAPQPVPEQPVTVALISPEASAAVATAPEETPDPVQPVPLIEAAKPVEAAPAPSIQAGLEITNGPIDPGAPKTAGVAPPPKADEPFKVAMKSAGEQEGSADAPAEQAPQEKSPHAQVHSAAATRTDAPKPDEVSNPQSGSPVSEAAHSGKPPVEAVHTAILQQAADRFAHLTTAAAQPSSAAPEPAAAVPIAGLAVEIAARAQAGRNRFEIRLDPPELGRIDVRLDVDRSGQVTSRLMVERAETLEVLRRDAGELERALQQAGLKTSDNGLQFALRDHGFAGRDDASATPNAAQLVVPDADLGPAEALHSGYGRVLRAGGIDIRV
jgi:flagellar hook-length control protein FliK